MRCTSASPGAIIGMNALAILVGDHVAAQFEQEFFQRHQRVADQWQGIVLVSVKLGDIDIDEAQVFVGESGFGGAGEVAVARADADDQIGFGRQDIGAFRASHADRAQIARIIISQRALAGLRFGHRDARQLDQQRQSVIGIAVMDAATGDDQWLLAGANPLRRPFYCIAVGSIARDLPDALFKEGGRVIVASALHILRQRQGSPRRCRRARSRRAWLRAMP